MDQITHDVRTAQWAEIVRSVTNAPQVNQPRNGWMKTESMKNNTTIGNEG